MSPQVQEKDSREMRPEYDFSRGVRGRHHRAYQTGTNVVFLEPDIAAVFPDSAAVNQALRLLVRLSKTTTIAGRRTKKALKAPSSARRTGKPRLRPRTARG